MSEEVLYQENPSMFRSHPVGFILSLILIPVVIGLIILLAWWLQCKGTELTVTSERTTLRRGILSKSLNEVWHRDIRNVQLYQSFFQRLLGVGRIGISSAGQEEIEILVNGMPNPMEVKGILDRFKRETQT